MSTVNMLIAGFGGQGSLFAGKFLAYKGLTEDKCVSWLPSYGPEMRGGTANCSVIVSDDSVGSPIVNEPDVLVALNLPSLDKFDPHVVPGGDIFLDSTLIARKVERSDVNAHYIPATAIAEENKLGNLANMVMMGYVMKIKGMYDEASIDKALDKVVPPSKPQLREPNLKALKAGMEYSE